MPNETSVLWDQVGAKEESGKQPVPISVQRRGGKSVNQMIRGEVLSAECRTQKSASCGSKDVIQRNTQWMEKKGRVDLSSEFDPAQSEGENAADRNLHDVATEWIH